MIISAGYYLLRVISRKFMLQVMYTPQQSTDSSHRFKRYSATGADILARNAEEANRFREASHRIAPLVMACESYLINKISKPPKFYQLGRNT